VKTLENFKAWQALILILVAPILWAANGFVLLDSISAYAYATPMTFCVLLMTPALLFIYDGVEHLEVRWYNIIQGALLVVVVLFRHEQYFWIHHVAAVLFFLGSLFEMVYFSVAEERNWKIIVAVAVLLGMAICLLYANKPILAAEWIGIIQMSIHTHLEVKGKIS
jgi:hypothetical protein